MTSFVEKNSSLLPRQILVEMQTKSDGRVRQPTGSTAGTPCAKRCVVLSRFGISILLAMMLPVAATPLSARSCILSNVPSEKMCKSGCCANKACCATSSENKATSSQPLAKADSSYKLNATSVALPSAVSPSWEYGARQFL